MSADTINKQDYVFVDGAEYTLPEDNAKVKRMVRQGALKIKPLTVELEQKQSQKKGARK